MDRLYQRAHDLTKEVIGAAIEVHKDKGPGLLESIYEWCLEVELELRGHTVRRQKEVTIEYKGRCRKEELRFDVLVEECLIVEIKAVEKVHPIHKAQLLSHMKLLDLPVGLLFNFHSEKLTDGVSRLILSGANI